MNPSELLSECPECGRDFTPEDPTCDTWCPGCALSDRWAEG